MTVGINKNVNLRRHDFAGSCGLPHPSSHERLALSVRTARPQDAADLARVYVESWQDTYAGVISHTLLATMSHKGHTARWLTAIKSAERNNGAVLVAEDRRAMASSDYAAWAWRAMAAPGSKGKSIRSMSILLSWDAARAAHCCRRLRRSQDAALPFLPDLEPRPQ